jgi:hypothetical protein
MKSPTVLLLLAASSALAQGNFQNLDFESGTLVPIPGDPYDRVLFSSAFPGWAGYVGTNLQTAALYNSTFLDSSGVSIIDPGWSASPGSFGISGPIQGNFTAILQAGVVGDITNPQDTSLSQTGLVPLNAKTLLFKAFFPGTGPNLAISLGGQPLSYSLISSGTGYGEYGADIHQWAGQTAELTLTALTQRPHQFDEYAFLDSIEFSATSIPEPSVLTLFAVGSMLLFWRILRQTGH